jgi:hypothetical protein
MWFAARSQVHRNGFARFECIIAGQNYMIMCHGAQCQFYRKALPLQMAGMET